MTEPLEHEERMANTDPALVAFARRVPEVLGGRWRIGRGCTTDAEQQALHDEGRITDGPGVDAAHPHGRCVTEARLASETAHGCRQFGCCALDFIAMRDDGTPDWTPPRYRDLGRLAKAMGFEWGGDFTRLNPRTGKHESFPDLGHVQVSGWRSIPLRQEKEQGNV